MSTKIYDGYKIKASTLEEAIELIKLGKAPVIEEFAKYKAKKEINHGIRFLLNFYVKQSGLFEEYLSPGDFKVDKDKLYRCALELAKEKEKENDDLYERNFGKEEVKIVLFPQKTEIKGENYYLLIARVPRDLEKAFFKSYSSISEYGYWNNSDKPTRITNKDWNKRKEHWDIAFDWSPEYEGLTLQIVNSENLLYVYDYKKSYTMQEKCVKQATTPEKIEEYTNRSFEIIMTNYLTKLNPPKDGQVYSDIININKKVRDNEFTPEEQIHADYVRRNLEILLPKTISRDMIYGSLEQQLVQIEKNALDAHIAPTTQTNSAPVVSNKTKRKI